MEKILIVDDKEANLYSLDALLEEIKCDEYQFETISALGGEEALRIAMSDSDVQLIILDIQMPDIDGFEVAKFLKSSSKTKHIPIIFLTAAFKADEFVKNGFKIGAIDYFSKPIEKHQFLNKIKLYLQLIIKNKKLKEMNLTLNQKVTEEVEKNKHQQIMMFQQSRLAQMGEMLSMIAHQWRQPLSAINATSIAMNISARFEDLGHKEVIDKTDKISEYAQYLSTTIEDFRDFFKEHKATQQLNYEELIKSVLNIVEISITNKDIEIKQDINCTENFETYPNEIKQVVLNLLKNAEDILLEKKIKNPFIKITTYQENNKYILEVNDNGGGVPESIINNIFDPYFSTKLQKDGTGLGLYMSKTIIEEHCKGKLSVSNNQDGAVFKITL